MGDTANETEAVVIAVEQEYAVVETGPRAAGCGRCYEPGGCGGGLLNLQSNAQTRRYRIDNDIQAKVGDRVWLCAAPGALLKAVLWTYAVPLLLILLGAALGDLGYGSDAAALTGGLLGLVAGLLLLRGVARRRESNSPLRLKSFASTVTCPERKSTI